MVAGWSSALESRLWSPGLSTPADEVGVLLHNRSILTYEHTMIAARRLLSARSCRSLSVNSFEKTAANYRQLTPLSYIERAAQVYDDSVAVVDGSLSLTWSELFGRCCALGDGRSCW